MHYFEEVIVAVEDHFQYNCRVSIRKNYLLMRTSHMNQKFNSYNKIFAILNLAIKFKVEFKY